MTRSTVGVHEAKTHLSRLLERVRAGEEIVIQRRGEPIAVLTAIHPARSPRFGTDRGRVTIGEDFDASLPDDLATTLGA